MQPPEIPVRQPIEVQWAHDLLTAVEETPAVTSRFTPGQQAFMKIARDALCWVLQHDRTRFESVIGNAADAMRAEGYAFWDAGTLLREKP